MRQWKPDEPHDSSSPLQYNAEMLRQGSDMLDGWRADAREKAEEYCRNYWADDRGLNDLTNYLLERLPPLRHDAVAYFEYITAQSIAASVHAKHSERAWRRLSDVEEDRECAEDEADE